MYLKCKHCDKICKVILCPKCGSTCLLKFDDDEERRLFRTIYYQINGHTAIHRNKFQQSELSMLRILVDIGLLKQNRLMYSKAATPAWNDIWMDFVEKIG
jgi:hypothetical protein